MRLAMPLFLLTGELVAAAPPAEGLVHEVVPADQISGRVGDLAVVLASRARVSQAGAKALLDRVAAGRLDEDEDEQALYSASLHSPEYVEGVAAFLAKRRPDFQAARRASGPPPQRRTC